jgi:hypothetical protein
MEAPTSSGWQRAAGRWCAGSGVRLPPSRIASLVRNLTPRTSDLATPDVQALARPKRSMLKRRI